MLLNPMWVVGAAELECEGLVTNSPWRDGEWAANKRKTQNATLRKEVWYKKQQETKEGSQGEEL